MNDRILFIPKDTFINVAVPQELKNKVLEYARRNNIKQSAAMRIIIASFFDSNLRKTQANNDKSANTVSSSQKPGQKPDGARS